MFQFKTKRYVLNLYIMFKSCVFKSTSLVEVFNRDGKLVSVSAIPVTV